MRTCSVCNTEKSLDNFRANRSQCKACEVKRVTAWQKANPEKVKANQRKWRDTHRSHIVKMWYVKKYNLTTEQVQAILDQQDGRCAICGSQDPGKRGWFVDHNHETGEVRGVLCMSCNVGLGHFKDSVSRLRSAIKYLQPQILMET